MKKLLFIFVSLIMLVACGSEETVDVEGELITYDELKTKITEAEQELNIVQDELSDVKKDLSDNSSKYEQLEELANNREEITKEVTEAESKLDRLESEIAKLEGDILKYKDEPIKISPGYFYFGDEIEPGRYKVTAQEGQRGNVFIRSGGSSYVAETFGDGTSGSLKEFTFTSSDGDEIEATIPIYLYPVE